MFLMYTRIVELDMPHILHVMYTLFVISSAFHKTLILTCQIIIREYMITDRGLYCDHVFRLVNMHFCVNSKNFLS